MRCDMKKKKIMAIVAIAGILLVMVTVGCIQIWDKDEEGLQKVRFAWFRGGTIIAQYAAQDLGYFEDEGLDVEIIYFKSTADAIPSVASGEIEFGMTSNTPILKSIEAGMPIKAVGLVQYASADEGHISIAYVALNESGIEDPQDLRGKKLAIPYVGGDAHIYLLSLLKMHGIEEDEVTFITVPWPNHIEALVKGEIDTASLFITHLAKMDLEGIGYNIVMGSSELMPRSESVSIYSSTDYIEKNPETVRKFLRAYFRGQAYLENHPEAYKEYLAEYLGWEPELLEKMDVEKIHGLPHGGRFNETNWQEFSKLMVDTGFLEEEIPLDRVLTEEYLPELEELEIK